VAISRVDENFSCCESKLFQLVIAIISGYLVSVVEECLSCGQALQEVHKVMIGWEIITLTIYTKAKQNIR